MSKNPEKIAKEHEIETRSINAIDIEKELGSEKVVNTILPGVLAQYLGIERKIWYNIKVDRMNLKKLSPKIMEINKKAFKKGFTT
ncbi:MAG: 2-oxoacid:acceptor oxidoreductase family protein [Acidobacteriota bacterium]|nr:2-oxoacid:acceptor oxidoreductase family protein [Acidobacteriota bacterium]